MSKFRTLLRSYPRASAVSFGIAYGIAIGNLVTLSRLKPIFDACSEAKVQWFMWCFIDRALGPSLSDVLLQTSAAFITVMAFEQLEYIERRTKMRHYAFGPFLLLFIISIFVPFR